MLQFTQPDIPACIAELEADGCDRIVAVPLFVAPSGHTLFDIPSVLGILASPNTRARIAEEGGRIAKPRVPVVMTAPLSEGEILPRFVVDEVRRLSRDPAKEAVVLLAHGDSDHQGLLDRLMKELTTHCCEKLEIQTGDWAFVETGKSYDPVGVAAIHRALAGNRRVIVVGLYVSLSAEKINQRALATSPDLASKLESGDQELIFSDRAIIDAPSIVEWVLEMAGEALG